MTDYDELARLAREATPGPWVHGYWSGQCHRHAIGKHPGEPECVFDYTLVHDDDDEVVFDNPHRLVSESESTTVAGNYDYEEGGIVHEADAAYIAAASPDVILALLEERRVLREALTKAESVQRCIFINCVATWRHWHGGFPGGYDDPADPEGAPIGFVSDNPDPSAVRDYNGAALQERTEATR